MDDNEDVLGTLAAAQQYVLDLQARRLPVLQCAQRLCMPAAQPGAQCPYPDSLLRTLWQVLFYSLKTVTTPKTKEDEAQTTVEPKVSTF